MRSINDGNNKVVSIKLQVLGVILLTRVNYKLVPAVGVRFTTRKIAILGTYTDVYKATA